MDNLPLTATALGRFYHIKGSEVERYYKYHLSDYTSWAQKEHSTDWVLEAQNIGEHLSIDETQLCGDVYTILSNKDGKGKKGTLVAIVKGTRSDVVSQIIKKIPTEQLDKVKEVTMDFSDSMRSIAEQCFPHAIIVIDHFHIMQRLGEALEELRLKYKRQAVTENKKAAAEFTKNEVIKAQHRKYYRKNHKKNPKETRGRKRIRKRAYKPIVLSNGDTKVELHTRSRNLLSQDADKWGEHKKERARLLFELHPELREAYSLICHLRAIFKKHSSVAEAKTKLKAWYNDVGKCTLREVKSARDCIKSRQDHILNFFINRSTNAAAESLNSKMKGFRAQLHGIADIPFFMFRLSKIFG
jgi:transposase